MRRSPLRTSAAEGDAVGALDDPELAGLLVTGLVADVAVVAQEPELLRRWARRVRRGAKGRGCPP